MSKTTCFLKFLPTAKPLLLSSRWLPQKKAKTMRLSTTKHSSLRPTKVGK